MLSCRANLTMASTESLYIGIDPTSGDKEFSYAALDGNLSLVKLAEAEMEELVAFLDDQGSAIVAVNAPGQVNCGLARQKLSEKRSSERGRFRGADIRLAELELRERGITITGTPSREEFCPAWMQVGFALYQRLSEMGFETRLEDNNQRTVLETHPYACFCALVEKAPFPKPTLEGRLQRQSILYGKGLRITDAMEFFEEITRFKLMKGILPTDILYTPDQLDVLVAAYTAWLVKNRPEEITRVGDESEGQITLPVSELQEKY